MIWSLTSHIILKIMRKIYFHLKVFVQSFSHVWLFEIPWTAVRQASLSISNSRGSPKPMSIESVMPSNHLIFCCPLLLLPSIFPSNRVFSNESALRMKWPKYWSFSFSIIPSKEHPGLISYPQRAHGLRCGKQLELIISVYCNSEKRYI